MPDNGTSQSLVPVGSAPPAAPATAQKIPLADPPLALSHYLWILRRHAWKIAGFVALCTGLTLIASLRMPPVYESTATLDLDRRMPTGVVGQEALPSTHFDADQYIATQARLIQSDSVLRPVAVRYRLLERPEEVGSLKPEEQARQADSPVGLKRLKVTRPTNTYLLLVSYRSQDQKLAAEVANAVAQSYIEHTYAIRYQTASGLSKFMERQLEELRAKMERSSAALAAFEKELNIINPEERTNILSARLLELNTEYTKAQTDRIRKEAADTSMRSGALEAAHVSSQSEALRRLTEDLHAARQRFAEVGAHYGPNHPDFKVARAQLAEVQSQYDATTGSIARRVEIEFQQASERERKLEQTVQGTKAELDNVNARSFEYQALKREAEGDRRLYEELLRKIKEETINASFNTGAARIADPARPGRRPVMPKTGVNVLLALLLSGGLAVGMALLTDLMDDTVRDPEQVRRVLRAEVIGSLPEVRPWKGQLAPILPSLCNAQPLAEPSKNGSRSLTGFEEAIRTLRNSILLADSDRGLRALLITSASPSEGKSTIAVHLALAHAQQHQRTLLIDGDLRRPSVHKRFEISNSVGLSNVLLGSEPWRSVVQEAPGVPGLDILPAGSASQRRAADIIGQNLEAILEEAAESYDLIVIDAPPLLGFSEPLQMAASADGVIIVARAGETSRKGVYHVLSTLQRIRANVVGLVLNEVHRQVSEAYDYYGYYGKYYRHYNGSRT